MYRSHSSRHRKVYYWHSALQPAKMQKQIVIGSHCVDFVVVRILAYFQATHSNANQFRFIEWMNENEHFLIANTHTHTHNVFNPMWRRRQFIHPLKLNRQWCCLYQSIPNPTKTDYKLITVFSLSLSRFSPASLHLIVMGCKIDW